MNVLYKKYRDYIVITLVSLISTCILWTPFLLKSPSIYAVQTPDISFQTVIQHWDGPLYIIPAKTFYDKDSDILKKSPMGLGDRYFAAHLPLYPVTIAGLAPLFGYRYAMLVSTLLASLLLFYAFYEFLKRLKLTKYPLILTLVFMFFTPRFFVTRSVGTPEPLFLLLILGSMYFFVKRKYFWAGLIGALSILTKTPGGLLFFAYGAFFAYEYYQHRKFNMNWLWIFLIPLGFLGLSTMYYFQLGDFFAYFNSGDNLHLLFPPYQVFNHQARWVATGWLEEILFIYMFYGYTLITLAPHMHFKSRFLQFIENMKMEVEKVIHPDVVRLRQVFFFFTLFFFAAIISVEHRDIARYSLPLLPIALITFEKFFTSRKFLIVGLILLPGVYAYAWNFMLVNIAPITDWVPFM